MPIPLPSPSTTCAAPRLRVCPPLLGLSLLGLLLSVFIRPAVCHAQTSPARLPASTTTRVATVKRPPSSPPKARPKVTLQHAKQAYRQGRSAFQRKEYRQALVAFTRSIGILTSLQKQANTPAQKARFAGYQRAFLSTLAVTCHWSKRYLLARRYYSRCVQQETRPKKKAFCQKYLAEVEKHLVLLGLRTSPKGAKITIVDLRRKRAVPVAPKGQWLLPGRFRIQISFPGYLSMHKELQLKAGARVLFAYRLQKQSCPSPTPTPPALERLLVTGSTPAVLATTLVPASLPPAFGKAPMPPWQIGLIVGGAVAGATLLGLGGYGIYYATSRTRYTVR